MHPTLRRGCASALPGLLALALTAQESRPSAPEDPAHDHATHAHTHDLATTRVGDATFRLVDLSLDALIAAGGSSVRDATLATLKGGHHDPRKRGFTLQNVELSATGAVDPCFDLQAHLVYAIDPLTGDSEVELEEAFATTQSLPAGLQLKAGHYLTEFGRFNTQHPHAWHWQDQPVIATRLFGGDGLRAPGARIGWRVPGPGGLELQAGVQNANGDTATSFLSSSDGFAERPIGGRSFAEREVRSPADLLWSLRAQSSFELGAATAARAGASLLLGPNATGAGGDTTIWGVDLALEWHEAPSAPDAHDLPVLLWQTEVMGRAYRAAAQVDANDPTLPGDDVAIPADRLTDLGLYSQVLWRFAPRWAAGIRGDWAAARGLNYDAAADVMVGRSADPFRNERLRVSPLLVHQPTAFSRLRLQYDYDQADHLRHGEAHTLMLGLEIAIGRHRAHDH